MYLHERHDYTSEPVDEEVSAQQGRSPDRLVRHAAQRQKAVRCVKSILEDVGFMPLYNHLKEYRAKINVNQHEMGQLVGVSRQTISQIERGDYSPSVTLALKIAKVFEVPVEAIFTYEEEPEEEK